MKQEKLLLKQFIDKKDMSNMDLSKMIFKELDFQNCDFTNSDLSGTRFIKCNCENANFSNCKINKNTLFISGSIAHANMHKVPFYSYVFEGCNAIKAYWDN